VRPRTKAQVSHRSRCNGSSRRSVAEKPTHRIVQSPATVCRTVGFASLITFASKGCSNKATYRPSPMSKRMRSSREKINSICFTVSPISTAPLLLWKSNSIKRTRFPVRTSMAARRSSIGEQNDAVSTGALFRNIRLSFPSSRKSPRE
jgi:hypothetical protein